jgi:hypothetical protein
MSTLKKTNLDKLFKKYIVKSEDITIVESYKQRCDFISDLASFFTSKLFKKYFKINTKNLEYEIAECKNNFRKRKEQDDFYFYRYGSQTEEEYLEEQLYSNVFGNYVDTFVLEKYHPTKQKADEVLLCELSLSRAAQSRIFFSLFFNDASQLCFDYISLKNTRKRRSCEAVENDIKTFSSLTSLDAVKNFVNSFPEEEINIKKEDEIRWRRNDKERVKKDKIKDLSSKAVVSRIKSILNETNISFFIDERIHMLKIYLTMKKGKTVIRVPKKDIKNRLEILPSLCEKLIEADQLNIQCKYHQNL